MYDTPTRHNFSQRDEDDGIVQRYEIQRGFKTMNLQKTQTGKASEDDDSDEDMQEMNQTRNIS